MHLCSSYNTRIQTSNRHNVALLPLQFHSVIFKQHLKRKMSKGGGALETRATSEGASVFSFPRPRVELLYGRPQRPAAHSYCRASVQAARQPPAERGVAPRGHISTRTLAEHLAWPSLLLALHTYTPESEGCTSATTREHSPSSCCSMVTLQELDSGLSPWSHCTFGCGYPGMKEK